VEIARMSKLPPKPVAKKLVFASEFLKDRNATNAAKRAGYSANTAYAQGSALLKDHEVAAYIAEHTAVQCEKNDVDLGRWLAEVNHSAYFDPAGLYKSDGTLLNVPDMPENIRRAIAEVTVVELYEGTGKDRVWAGYTKKIKLVSKDGMLTLAARQMGILKDNLTVNDEGVSARLAAAERALSQHTKPKR
jgi:phage terminase small subunit